LAKSAERQPVPKQIKWLKMRKRFQLAAGILFLGLLVYSQWGFYLHPGNKLPGFILNLPLRLDPLAMLSKIIASRVLAPVELLFLITILVTLLFGRVWCGWFCPLGIVQDWTAGRGSKGQPGSVPEWWRLIKYGLLTAILGLAAFSNLSLLIFDPLTIFIRSLTASLLPAVDNILTVIEKGLFKVNVFRDTIGRVDSWIRPRILPFQPDQFRAGAFYGLLFLIILLLNLYLPRFYCRYICPLGGLLGLLSKFSLVKPRIREGCSGCGVCVSRCPTGAIQDRYGLEVHPAECTMCMVCSMACPQSALEITSGEIGLNWGPYDPGRRTALISFAAVVVGAGYLGTDINRRLSQPHLLRPPGTEEEDLLKTCLRCGECSAACPTNAIQLSVFEKGLEGLWTPVLIPRIGYCDFSCNACGQVCPVGAIPFLDLEQKRTQVIGKAYINKDRCIAWADQRDCIVCEEMCPLPEKAITIKEVIAQNPQGEDRVVLLPEVDRSRCIGCGICEHKCPLNGEAAIRVYVQPSPPGLYSLGIE
jgi:ferredoxin